MTVCCPARRPPPRKAGLWQECSCAVLGGLLCSSCCLVQLLLNSFSIGCAGFSSLTSYRPLFLSVTAATLLGNYLKYRNKRRTLLALALAFGLTITPEIVGLYNKNEVSSLRLAFWTRSPQSSSTKERGQQEQRTFSVSGLRCQACCARLKRHILEQVGVESCEVDFAKAIIHVQGSSLQESKLVKSIQELGYSAKAVVMPAAHDIRPNESENCRHNEEV